MGRFEATIDAEEGGTEEEAFSCTEGGIGRESGKGESGSGSEESGSITHRAVHAAGRRDYCA